MTIRRYSYGSSVCVCVCVCVCALFGCTVVGHREQATRAKASERYRETRQPWWRYRCLHTCVRAADRPASGRWLAEGGISRCVLSCAQRGISSERKAWWNHEPTAPTRI